MKAIFPPGDWHICHTPLHSRERWYNIGCCNGKGYWPKALYVSINIQGKAYKMVNYIVPKKRCCRKNCQEFAKESIKSSLPLVCMFVSDINSFMLNIYNWIPDDYLWEVGSDSDLRNLPDVYQQFDLAVSLQVYHQVFLLQSLTAHHKECHGLYSTQTIFTAW